MDSIKFKTFVESFRDGENNKLLDVVLEGFDAVYEPQMEGIGDTFRNAKNKVKTLGSMGKQAMFGASEEDMLKNVVSQTILNKKLYDSTSRYGQSAINKILKLIYRGTRDPKLPDMIAQLADNVLVDIVENALTSNPRIQVKIYKPSELREKMDYVYDEIADSVIKPLEKLGRTTINDDRRAIVTSWWDKNVVPKMGKYFDAMRSTQYKIISKKEKPVKQEPPADKPKRKQTRPLPPKPEGEFDMPDPEMPD